MRPFSEMKIKPSSWVYYGFISLLIINDSLANSLFPNYSESLFAQCMLLAELALAILCLFLQCNRQFSLTFFAITFVTGCAAYLFGGRTGLILTLLAAVLGRDADADAVLKLVFWLKLLVFILVVGHSLMDVLPGKEALLKLSNAETKGATLGYGHSNTFSAVVVMLLLLFAMIHRHKLSLWKLLLIGVAEAANYYLTRSRIGMIVVAFFIVLALCAKNKQLRALINQVGKFFFLFIVLLNFSLVLMRLFADNDTLSKLDIKIFNGRIGFSAMYVDTYGLSLFGAKLEESLIAARSWYYALDNGYTIVLLYYGIFGLAMFLTTYQLTVLELSRKKETMLVITAMCFSVWMMFEGITITASGNFIFLLLGKMFAPCPPKRRRLAW